MNFKIIVGQNIKKLRTEKNISQEKLSELAQIDRTYSQSIEAGKRNFSIEVLMKISKALNVRPNDILKGLENEF